MTERQIRADYDDEGIYVYQAFRPAIVQAALKQGTLGGGGFSLNRMTWIKPSWGWMLYRAGYGMKEGQEGILRLKLSHEGFQQGLAQAVASTWNPSMFTEKPAWKQAVDQSLVRIQWDPDRNLHGGQLAHRAIQIGLRGAAVTAYIQRWIIGVEEVTALAQAIKTAIDNRLSLPEVPTERVYPVSAALSRRLDITV